MIRTVPGEPAVHPFKRHGNGLPLDRLAVRFRAIGHRLRNYGACVALLASACGDQENLRPSPTTGTPNSILCPTCSQSSCESASPLAYGLAELERASTDSGTTLSVRLVVANDECGPETPKLPSAGLLKGPESFAIVPNGSETVIVGPDETGAMYGALELAERLRAGDPLPAAPIAKSPATPIRAANLFLPIQTSDEPSWWFLDEDFWTQYLDMLAHARFNVLDLHGMYEVASSLFPNALLYFGHSRSYPDVGLPVQERERNVAMLRHVLEMAASRGIRVGFMTYRTDLMLKNGDPGPNWSDDQVAKFTREAVADLVARAPKLWRIGFRIGESHHRAAWYGDAFLKPVLESNTGVGVYTRSWLIHKPDILGLANQTPRNLLVEVKYNGEQLGPPYVVAGGEMIGLWPGYSYEDYLDPPLPLPYQFLFQIRSGGTHRLFRHASYSRIQRTVKGALLGASEGFSLEAPHAFFPMRDNYHADPSDRYSPWTFRRDELQYAMFGRLAYDLDTPESAFRALLRSRAGTDALWDAIQAASDIIPWIQTVHQCGLDQRQFAADLEWGGTVGYWASPPDNAEKAAYCDTHYHGPMDTFAFSSPYEFADALSHGRQDMRISPLTVATLVLESARKARGASTVVYDSANAEARDMVRECVALADFGDYFGHKLRSATALAIYDATGANDYLSTARTELEEADNAWRALSRDTAHIAPFFEPMRMPRLGYSVYHWSMATKHLGKDPASIAAHEAAVLHHPIHAASQLPTVASLFGTEPDSSQKLVAIIADPVLDQNQMVTVTFSQTVPPQAIVNLLWKEFSALSDWQSQPMDRLDSRSFRARISKTQSSGFFAAEVLGHRYPDVRTSAPYIVVAP